MRNRIYQGLRYLGAVLWGVGVGLLIASHLIKELNWNTPALFTTGLFLAILSPQLWNIRSKQERKDRQEKAHQKYESHLKRFGLKTLKRIRTTSIGIALTSMIFGVGFALGTNSTDMPILMLICFGTAVLVLFVAAWFGDPEAFKKKAPTKSDEDEMKEQER